MERKPLGAVLVVGGGIAGIQSALDLAESGFYVYLVEKSPSLGGLMARLDKTFPTNDCSMCILSPKLVECGRHLNIEVLSMAEVLSVEGEPGDFTVKVRERPRYVSLEDCTGCGECAEVCPVNIPDDFEGNLSLRRAIYRPFPQAFPGAFLIEKRGVPNCQAKCPLEQRAQGYIALIRAKRFEEALKVVRMDNPFPGICGRACHHPCMEECQRGMLDAPLRIPYLKRFLADFELTLGKGILPQVAQERPERIAVIGAGPSGLSCAYFLRLLGYQVVVFEAQDRPGGMMVFGIPPYRLPRNVVEREISFVQELGVEIQCRKVWGRDFVIDDLFAQGFQAVYLACGAWRGMKLGIEGEDDPRVLDGLAYLVQCHRGEEVPRAKRVVVVGGGNVAIDCARVALRRGAEEVAVYYRRSEEEMPARREEVEEAREERVKFFFCAAPRRFFEKSGELYLEFCGVKLCAPDESGRRRPEILEGTEFVVSANLFIVAAGQNVAIPEEGLTLTRRGTVEVDEYLMTSRKGVFAGGDLVLGPATLVEAIAYGKRAAYSIDAFLSGKPLQRTRRSPALPSIPWGKARNPGKLPRKMPASQRVQGFEEVVGGYTLEEAEEEARRCLSCGGCAECLQCVEACKRGAIHHDDRERVREIKVGAVVVSTGTDVFHPEERLQELGYGRYPNVVTSLDFERILSASGPTRGKVVRPGDGKVPRKVAFVQCVGSRDPERGKSYCSSVCCMYAIKEALVAQEHLLVEGAISCSSSVSRVPPRDGLEVAIFMIDMRAYGKDFERYYERARASGIRFIRGRVSHVLEGEHGDPVVFYVDEKGGLRKEVFDLVVLSVGLTITEEGREALERLGIPADEEGFPYLLSFGSRMAQPGIWVSGSLAGPKDIPSAVVEVSAASCEVASLLCEGRFSMVREKTYPPERDIATEPVRVGVFVCRCGVNIAGIVRTQDVVEWVKSLPHVVYAEENLYTCSQDTQRRIKEKIQEHRLNRIVIASCSPRTHEPLFRETLREVGLNPYLITMANIRDQCSWVHQREHDQATEKAKDLVAMAVARAVLLEPLQALPVPIEKSVLVVGGGISGMTAALEAAEQGLSVYLVEREESLGGQVRGYGKKHTIEGKDLVAFSRELEERLLAHPRVRIFTESEVLDVQGFVGNFETVLRRRSETITLRHGGVVIATGAREYLPRGEFLWGLDERVLTQNELEKKLNQDSFSSPQGQVVMIQCVGSRNAEHPYCSRVCCVQAVKNALRLKELFPACEVLVLYQDMRTYGLYEWYYREARRKGVLFVRFADGVPPLVERERERLRVTFFDPLLEEEVRVYADFLILSTGVEAHPEAKNLAKLFKVPLNEDGFFLEAHVKLRPVDFATEGIYVCGMAHGPKLAEESVLQAKAAVSRLMTVLIHDGLLTEAQVASVDEKKCVACGDCERVCQYRAIAVNAERGVAEVNRALCKGCGLCSATCKSSAIQVLGLTPEAVLSEVEYLYEW
ncbi:MAG: FAD-dependent oxidoreductase [Candidatus Caldatribacteriaceae bacterium]